MATLRPTLARAFSTERHASPRGDIEETSRVVAPARTRRRPRKKLVLCFDGTGNKFNGTQQDSNVLAIYRCLARNAEDQFCYYQPGIGTYVTTSSLSQRSHWARLKSWSTKMKDSAVGTSFGEHVMCGYKFLMRYYSPGDHIFFFGFSRGAYIARFLAEMIDTVGLLSAGNEEMSRFAWKTFRKWQQRLGGTPAEKKEKDALLEFMCAFRETFSRPVHRIRFLGLFDTVTSVPQFENAWMRRKFPYTARSTAKVIRHAVAIDERRAKFRQDLISEVRTRKRHHGKEHYHSHHRKQSVAAKTSTETKDRGRKAYDPIPTYRTTAAFTAPPFRDASETCGLRAQSPGFGRAASHERATQVSLASVSQSSLEVLARPDEGDESSDEEQDQDILEVWFPGCHADIGGGWPLEDSDDAALSHVPLVWMIREATRAGLRFDEQKLRQLSCCDMPLGEDEITGKAQVHKASISAPGIFVRAPTLTNSKDGVSDSTPQTTSTNESTTKTNDPPPEPAPPKSDFHRLLDWAATKGRIHDVLKFNNGASHLGVISWNLMEYLPFRRMDLREDGSWEAITWPLPKGEVRDIPHDAIVHNSVIRRMNADPTYRPGNLIIGGGGRGVRKAPEELGIGKWRVEREEGDVVGECWVRRERTVVRKVETAMSYGTRPGGPIAFPTRG